MEKRPSKIPETHPKDFSHFSKAIAIAALGLTSLTACKATDILGSPDPTATFARGAIGTALLGMELLGVKPLDNALNHDTSPGKALFKIGAMIGLPIVAGIVSEMYPIASYFLFYTPAVVGLIYLTSLRPGSKK